MQLDVGFGRGLEGGLCLNVVDISACAHLRDIKDFAVQSKGKTINVR